MSSILTSTLTLTTKLATASTVNKPMIENLATNKQVMATTDGLLHLFTIFKTAFNLSLYFFKYFFIGIYSVIYYFIAPFVWIIKFMWSQFIIKPFDLLLYLFHLFYPIIVFFFAAICCGIFIGSCAGFAAEAFSSILISATWGPQTKEEQVVAKELQFETEDEDQLQDEPFKKKTSRSSSISSYKPSISIENWRNSFSSASSSKIPSSSNSSVLIRKMKLSSIDDEKKPTNIKSRKNSWEWDEDEDEDLLFNANHIRKRK